MTKRNKRMRDAAPELLQALQYLATEVWRLKLNIRKDFSLLNAHACATKLIHRIENP
ncbi:MAG TPA: hypothetical protein VF077_13060 [Nitrospiraceae bacterium]